MTHDQVEALSLATKLAVLHDGVIQDYGDPMEVYRNPRNSWVAAFVGNPPMNVLRATVAGGRAVVKGGLALPLSESYRQVVSEGQEVLVGFRPEDVRLGSGNLRGKVSMVERVGAYTVLHVDVGGDLIRLLSPSLSSYSAGDEVVFDVPPEATSVFDAKTGVNLLRRPH